MHDLRFKQILDMQQTPSARQIYTFKGKVYYLIAVNMHAMQTTPYTTRFPCLSYTVYYKDLAWQIMHFPPKIHVLFIIFAHLKSWPLSE